MTLKEELFEVFGIEYHIKGGWGDSIEDPIIIERTDSNEYVSSEREILAFLCLGAGSDWKKTREQLLTHNNRFIDKIEIEITETMPTKVITEIEYFYFDITDCIWRE